ncbi:RNA polymerase II C-terminal domain kinase beta subunit [Microbotryomycetes sp. JL201]|nr:RNA polymerase II C-terminal domain kinase beta subunit [Microbotryomycetes sp. JL201]
MQAQGRPRGDANAGPARRVPAAATAQVPSNGPAAVHAQSPPVLSVSRRYKAYYSPQEVTQRTKLNSLAPSTSRSAVIDPDTGRKLLSEQRVDAQRQLACGFIDRVGQRLGFPRRTIATAQSLFHRFHLHHQLKDFAHQDISVAALLVAAKHQDTLKKLGSIQIAAWQVQNMIEGGNGQGDGDSTVQEAQRHALIGIERMILQTICFNFNPLRPLEMTNSDENTADSVALGQLPPTGRDVFQWLGRLSLALDASKRFSMLAHLVAIDVFRTLAPLSYPPHTCATAAIFLATFLYKRHANAVSWLGEEASDTAQQEEGQDTGPNLPDGWIEEFQSTEEDVHAVAIALLDLFIQLCPPPAAVGSSAGSAGTSPAFAGPSPTSMLASPVDPQTSTRASAAQIEKEKHLAATGVPHTLGYGWGGHLDEFERHPASQLGLAGQEDAEVINVEAHANANSQLTGWNAATSCFAPRSESDLMKIKIRLRQVANESRERRRKRLTDPESTSHQEAKRLRIGVEINQKDLARWNGGQESVRDIADARQEFEDLERERAERRLAKENGTADSAELAQQADRKLTSVRYMF